MQLLYYSPENLTDYQFNYAIFHEKRKNKAKYNAETYVQYERYFN